jgi:hypothetical protein
MAEGRAPLDLSWLPERSGHEGETGGIGGIGGISKAITREERGLLRICNA